MSDIPFYLLVLVEIVTLESVAIIGFFVYRWWRERQDQVVLQSLLTAIESSAALRREAIQKSINDNDSNDAEPPKNAANLEVAEVLFQKRVLAAFRNHRLLSLARLPQWTDELFVPVRAIIDQGRNESSDGEGIPDEQVDALTHELAETKGALQQRTDQVQALEMALESSRKEAVEANERMANLEKEYESAFHPSGRPQGKQSEAVQQGTSSPGDAEASVEALSEGVATTSDSTQDEPAAPSQENLPQQDHEATQFLIDEDDEEDNHTAFAIEDMAPEGPLDPNTGGENDEPSEEPEPVSEEKVVNDHPAKEQGVSELAEGESKVQSVEDTANTDTVSTDSDWGDALAEQTAAKTKADAEMTGPDQSTDLPVGDTDDDTDINWDEALAEQDAANQGGDSPGQAPSEEAPVARSG